MAAILEFGIGTGDVFRAGSAGVTESSSYELDGAQVPWLEVRRWDITLRLIKDGVTSLDAQVADLRSIFSAPRDSVRIINQDTTTSHMSVAAGQTLGGVRVVRPPSFPSYKNGEQVTVRTVELSLEFVLPLYTSAYQIIEFDEKVVDALSGRVLQVLQPNAGLAEIQAAVTNQHAQVQQSGSITYAAAYGPIPPPLFPSLQAAPVTINVRHPRNIGRGALRSQVGFSVDYTYNFVSSSSLVALPTRWYA